MVSLNSRFSSSPKLTFHKKTRYKEMDDKTDLIRTSLPPLLPLERFFPTDHLFFVKFVNERILIKMMILDKL